MDGTVSYKAESSNPVNAPKGTVWNDGRTYDITSSLIRLPASCGCVALKGRATGYMTTGDTMPKNIPKPFRDVDFLRQYPGDRVAEVERDASAAEDFLLGQVERLLVEAWHNKRTRDGE